MRIARFIMLWLVLTSALVPALCCAQDKTLTVRPLSDTPAIVKRALVIGVDGYKHANALPETINDARRFADILHTRLGFPEDSITLMTDAPGTKDELIPTYLNLLAAFDNLVNAVGKESEIVVFYSGHGTRLGDHDYLIPLDGLPGNVKASCIDYDDFKSRLNTKSPARALLFVDACRDLSGKGNESGIEGSVDVGPQIAELVSCQAKELSQIGKPEDFHESVFTHFLLAGLAGDPEAVNGAGLVTFDSLKVFVRSKVSRYVASKLGESQNPEGHTTLGSMVLARGAAPDNLLSTEARLLITSDPPGATVTIDDEVKGKTPLTVTLDLGLRPKRTIQIGVGGLDMYKAQLFPMELLRGKQAVRAVTLLPIKSPMKVPRLGLAPHPDAKYGMELVEIPAGEFTMGSTSAEIDAILASDSAFQRAWFAGELPQHMVYLDAYYIAKNVVTVKQYLAFCAATGHAKPPAPPFDPNWNQDDHPIVNVSWNDATAYCIWLSEQTGLKVSLPTEAQWEKASRGGDDRTYPWGNAWNTSKLWCSVGSKRSGTCAVGQYVDSPYGLSDMAGNVWQWCSDWYDASYYKGSPNRNPTGPPSSPQGYRVLRGGSFDDTDPDDFRCAYRFRITPDNGRYSDGFRCVVSRP